MRSEITARNWRKCSQAAKKVGVLVADTGTLRNLATLTFHPLTLVTDHTWRVT